MPPAGSGGVAAAGAGSGGAAASAGTGGGLAGSGGGIAGSGGGVAGTGGGSGGSLDPSAIIVSDNFDLATANAAPDAAKWQVYEQWAIDQGLAPMVDAAKFHTAPHSARVRSTNSGIGSFLVPVSGLPTADNRFYVRVWMNWENATATIMGHSGFIVGSTARMNDGTELRLGISNKGPGDEAMLDLNLIGGAGGEVTRYSNGFTDGADPGGFSGAGFQFAADTWYCVEAYFNGGDSEFRVWIDGTELMEMHVTDFQGSAGGPPRTTWAPTFNILKIGAQDYDANLGQIWYDDVIVATQPIGCG
jgi:hypothetical protein